MDQPEVRKVSDLSRKQTELKDGRIESFISYELPLGVIEANNASFTESKNSQDDVCPLPNDSPIKHLTTNNKLEPYANQANLNPINERDEGHNPTPLDMNLVKQKDDEEFKDPVVENDPLQEQKVENMRHKQSCNVAINKIEELVTRVLQFQ